MENYVNGESDYFNGGLIMLGSSSPTRSQLPISSPPSASVTPGSDGRVNCILHTVSKFDTLAGVAIKYGVEVADIKKLNGLVTDLQMFALKTLRIPLPGRHPPSPILSIGHETQGTSSSDQSQPSRRHSDLFDSFQSLKLKSCSKHKVSGSMNNLRGYYGLNTHADQNRTAESCEMAVYRRGGDHYLEDTNPPLSHHRKSRSMANGFGSGSANGDLANPLLSQASLDDSRESDKWFMKLLGRREKSLVDLSSTPEKLLKKDSSSSSSSISPLTGKGLALRPKSGNQNVVVGSGDYSSSESSSSAVRKSSSTPSLQQDTENGGALSSLWPTSKWNLKPDFQAIGIPIFDGLPKHMGRRNKAALD